MRGYAVKSLSAKDRAETGQRVADYFASRPARPLTAAASRLDLLDAIQVVQALNLAGKTKEALEVLQGDLRWALSRLELVHDYLALLQPHFPDGWSSPPSGTGDLAFLAGEAGFALGECGSTDEASLQRLFSIREGLKEGLTPNLCINLRGYAVDLRAQGPLAQASQVLQVAREVAEAIEQQTQCLWCDIFLMSETIGKGELADARALWTNAESEIERVGAFQADLLATAITVEAALLRREKRMNDEIFRKKFAKISELGDRSAERALWKELGEWHLSNGRHDQAIDGLARAIEMAHAVGLRDRRAEVLRGVALARAGRRGEAEDVLTSRADFRASAALAELCVELGKTEEARDHARAAYKINWADGPPFCWHWELEKCREVLRSIGEPEPELPPFDPARIMPFELEAEINRMIAAHRSRKTHG